MKKISTLLLIPINVFRSIQFLKPNPYSKKYPRVIQLPITYNCDSRCVTCNIWKINKEEITFEEFEKAMSDPIFKKVNAVGINGGEPSLVPNLDEYAKTIINKLPKLKNLSLISHGFHGDKLLSLLEKIYRYANIKGINFFVSISLDGYKKAHELSRRYPDAFEKTMKSVFAIKNGIGKYAHQYEVACTISRINADYISELDTYAKVLDLNIKYRMAENIKRLDNVILFKRYNAFGGFTAREHFYYYFKKMKKLSAKWRYFGIFYSIISFKSKRLLGCKWQDRGITFDAYGNIYYCAVRSKKIGNLLKTPGKQMFYAKNNLDHRREILKTCNTCSHDYSGKKYYKNYLKFIFYLLFEKFWIYQFKYI